MRPTSPVSCVLIAALVGFLMAGVMAQSQEASPPDDEPEILGASAAFSLEEAASERVWIEEGAPLFQDADSDSERLDRIDIRSELEVLQRSGDWRQVRYRARLGWVNPDLSWEELRVDVELRPETLSVAVGVMEVDSLERIDKAQRVLGLDAPNGRLGPYSLMTDVTDEGVLDYLDEIATALGESYRERFGLEPTSPEEQFVALFEREDTYRSFTQATADRITQSARGHSGGRLASFYLERHSDRDAGTLLVHELAHLMNRSTLGPTPPQWAEEGLANDLAYCRKNSRGELMLGTLAGKRITSGSRRTLQRSVEYSGAIASLSVLLKSRVARQTTPLAALVDMDRDDFLADEHRQRHYIESAFLVRFLLEADRGRMAPALRDYLVAAGKGEPANSESLSASIGKSWDRLEQEFDAWLRIEAGALFN